MQDGDLTLSPPGRCEMQDGRLDPQPSDLCQDGFIDPGSSLDPDDSPF